MREVGDPLKNSASNNLPRPPAGLSAASKKLWRELRDQYGISDSAGLLILASAMQAHTRAERARAIITKEGEVVLDRFQQRKANPACQVERDARSGMLMALRQLKLELPKALPDDYE